MFGGIKNRPELVHKVLLLIATTDTTDTSICTELHLCVSVTQRCMALCSVRLEYCGSTHQAVYVTI
jgi:hypothetical protein